MADTPMHKFVDKRLNIARETELLQSFVRVNVDDGELADPAFDKPEQIVQKSPVEDGDAKRKPALRKRVKFAAKKKASAPAAGAKKRARRRRRKSPGSRPQEVYCDKDRAAAVNLGSKDIKQDLKLKKEQDRSRTLQIPDEAEPSTFLALGNYEMCRGDLKIALDFMTKALELNPMEKSALVARSKCYILLGQPENALKDAETALSLDKNFLKAIYQKAESLYYLGDFEHSLMYYHRGLHIRPDHEGFKLGVHKAQKAIENAIGSAFPHVGKLSIRGGGGGGGGGTPKDSDKSTLTRSSPESRPKTDTTRTTTSKSGISTKLKSAKKSRLLRELGPDKDYLDNLIANPNIKCKYKDDDSNIEKCIQETVDYLNARQEFWRQQLPPHLK